MGIAQVISPSHWVAGHLSGVERVLSAAGPVLLLLSYFGVAALWYAIRQFHRAPFLDEEIARRPGGVLGARGIGHFFAWTMGPWWRLLARARFPPNVITSLSLHARCRRMLPSVDGHGVERLHSRCIASPPGPSRNFRGNS